MHELHGMKHSHRRHPGQGRGALAQGTPLNIHAGAQPGLTRASPSQPRPHHCGGASPETSGNGSSPQRQVLTLHFEGRPHCPPCLVPASHGGSVSPTSCCHPFNTTTNSRLLAAAAAPSVLPPAPSRSQDGTAGTASCPGTRAGLTLPQRSPTAGTARAGVLALDRDPSWRHNECPSTLAGEKVLQASGEVTLMVALTNTTNMSACACSHWDQLGCPLADRALVVVSSYLLPPRCPLGTPLTPNTAQQHLPPKHALPAPDGF